MSVKLWLEYANFLNLALCLLALFVFSRKGVRSKFKMLAFYALAETTNELITIPILFFRKALGIPFTFAANAYFYASWINFFLLSGLMICVVYSVYHLAMEPLAGLHRMGKLVFGWVSAVAIVLSVTLGMVPHLSSSDHSAVTAWLVATSQIQQAISILTLCLLLFVCFAIKPLGLTFRSRIFGVSLGLGVTAMTILVSGALSGLSQTQSVYSPVNLINSIGAIFAYAVWITYFALPEPERRMILLPTTSPYFFWNAISEALGDDPGHVVVAGFTPSSLATAELNLLTEQAGISVAYREAEPASQPELETVPPTRRRATDRQLATAS